MRRRLVELPGSSLRKQGGLLGGSQPPLLRAADFVGNPFCQDFDDVFRQGLSLGLGDGFRMSLQDLGQPRFQPVIGRQVEVRLSWSSFSA